MSEEKTGFILPELTKELIEDIKNYAMAQMSMDQIGWILGMDTDAFLAFRKKYPEVRTIIKTNRHKMIAKVASSLIENANKMKDTNAQKFFLERKGGWWNKKQVEITGKNGQPITTANANITPATPMTPEQAHEYYLDLCRQGKNEKND